MILLRLYFNPSEGDRKHMVSLSGIGNAVEILLVEDKPGDMRLT